MRINFKSSDVNFKACYITGKYHYSEQAKIANKIQEFLKDKESAASNLSCAEEVENKGWDILVHSGKCLNTASVSLAKGVNFAESKYFAYKKFYVGDYYKGNIPNIKEDIDSRLNEEQNSSHLMKVISGVMMGVISLLTLSCFSKCSTYAANIHKKDNVAALITKQIKNMSKTINLYK